MNKKDHQGEAEDFRQRMKQMKKVVRPLKKLNVSPSHEWSGIC